MSNNKPLSAPEFGSYSEDDVLWLLKDLSDISLEAPLEERENAIQNGEAHYAEQLPIEYQPDADYMELFHVAMAEKSKDIAVAVAKMTEQVVKDIDVNDLTIVSLARAGTPIGILMKRYLKKFYNVDVPHYAVSIVRGKGIDYNALSYIAERHDSSNAIFVDGWTGKGAIARELNEAIELYNKETGHEFVSELAVLADPGYCSMYYGTREDFLIPSACLNSTVSGLISRTVLNDDYIGAQDFHGAKYYKDFAENDLSNMYVDSVEQYFDALTKHEVEPHPVSEKLLWSGMEEVERVAEEYGSSINFVKPGVGETTRVLLRRVPWIVLYNPEKEHLLSHVFALAKSKNVPLKAIVGLKYSCIGVVKNKSLVGE